MDEFKKHIQNHAEELDLDEPRPQVWQNIQRESQAVKKPSVVMMVTRWAAAACLLVLAGIGAWSVLNSKTDPTVQVAVVPPVQQTDTPGQPVTPPTVEETTVTTTEPVLVAETKPTPAKPDYKAAKKEKQPANNTAALAILHNIETSFTQVINLQRDRVSTMPMYAESPEYFKDFKIQIRQMEKDEKVIKSDIAKRGMNDDILDQLINLYQQKLNTLKQLQIEMNKTNNRYKQNRGPVDSAKIYFMNL